MSVERIVVVNFTRMGDLIQSGPFMRSLKTEYPNAQMTVVVFNAFHDVADKLAMVDEVIGFDVDRFVPRLDARRGNLSAAYNDVQTFLKNSRLQTPDLLYNLAHTPQSATLCRLMNPRRAFGNLRLHNGQRKVVGEWFNYLFSVMDDRTYQPFNLVEIYLRAHETRTTSPRLEFRITDDKRRQAAHLLENVGIQLTERYIVMQPGASSRSRQWPPAYFAELAVLLSKSGYRSVVVGSTEEKALADRIVQLSRQTAVSLAGQTDVGSLAAVLEGAQRLVSNDTGTIHLAAAVGTPTIGIFLGPASAKDTAPYGNDHIIVEADVVCAPCGYHSECREFSCHRHVAVNSIVRLCLAKTSQTAAVARQLSGVRIYRTRVDEDGKFTLEKLNHPATGSDYELLDFYRVFWDRLLPLNIAPPAIPNRLALIDRSKWQTGVERLREILEHSERWLFAFLEVLQQSPANTVRVAELLRGGEFWRNDLRQFTNDFPQLSPISRFLLVQLHSVRNDGLQDHIEDISEVITTFEKAVALLGNAVASDSMRRERVAVA